MSEIFCVFGKRCNFSLYLHMLSLKHCLSYQEIVQRCIEHFSWVKRLCYEREIQNLASAAELSDYRAPNYVTHGLLLSTKFKYPD
jgi:hypothetical protein